jgi:photosystem II stability/assembly factor-like uncharacterized protein
MRQRVSVSGRWVAATLAVAALVVAGCTSGSAAGPSHSPAEVSSTQSPSSSAPASTTTPVAPPSKSTSTPPPPSIAGLQVADVTFVGSAGWALGTAACRTGSGRCAAIAHSTDSGKSWRGFSSPKVNVFVPSISSAESCKDPCVGSIRFATTKVGYLFGSAPLSSADRGALFMTTDGGRSWTRQAGGADALESLDGNVIRVVDKGGCPPGCTYRVQTSAIGGTSWKTVALPGAPGGGDGVQLVRTGHVSALEVYANPAGGANNETAVLWTSVDNGAHWTRRGEPCPQSSGGEVDSRTLSSAPDGSLTILCTSRTASGNSFTTTSTNGGASFHPGSRTALGGGDISAFGAASSKIFLVSSDDTYRSTDGGRHFARVGSNSGGSPGQLAWLGFASTTLGHAVSIDRRTIWTTTDSGRTWNGAAFH